MVHMDGAITKDGMVALQHWNANQQRVQIKRDGAIASDYTFVAKNNVCMAWVKEEDVAWILSQKTKLCCGKSGAKFHFASQINVNLWETGDRHGNVK